MKHPYKLLLVALIALTVSAAGCSMTVAGDAPPVESVRTANAPENAEIAAALSTIERAPESPIGHVQLAAAYLKLGRETGITDFNKKAEGAVGKALELDRKDVPARKVAAALHLSGHRFDEALALGTELFQELPKDPYVLGVLTDANAELGNYPQAVEWAQKMVDQKPNSTSYARVAHMRSLHGDYKGSVEMYTLAARTTDPMDKEAQSWGLVQLGDQHWKNGEYQLAEKVYTEALAILPDYYLAKFSMGRLKASQKNFDAAIEHLSAVQSRTKHLEATILLGDTYAAAGNEAKAKEYYALAEQDEDKHRIALLWADQDRNLDEALQIARDDYAGIKDIYAADILAWCLYKKGSAEEAKKLIQEAMRIKTNDARILYHAGMIEAALGNKSNAIELLRSSLKLNPQFQLSQADAARRKLAELEA